MTSNKQTYKRILVRIKAMNQAGINVTVKKIFKWYYSDKVTIHTVRRYMKNMVKEGLLTEKKVKGSLHFTPVKIDDDKWQEAINTIRNMDVEHFQVTDNEIFFRLMSVAPHEMPDDHNWELEIDNAIKELNQKTHYSVFYQDKNYFSIFRE